MDDLTKHLAGERLAKSVAAAAKIRKVGRNGDSGSDRKKKKGFPMTCRNPDLI